ncbi:MAG: hypothetical protein ACTHJ3_02610 [Pararhizobium sp.]
MYVIKITREFYGPETKRSLLTKGNGHAEQFDALAVAKAHIAELDSDRYHLSHNESSRPTYKVVRVDSLPAYLANYL